MPDSRLETGATNIRLLWPALQSQVSELNNFLHKKRISPFRPRGRKASGAQSILASPASVLRPKEKWHRETGAICKDKKVAFSGKELQAQSML